MNRLSGLGQPRGLIPSLQRPSGGPPAGRRPRPAGRGIFLITIGSILLFALSASSVGWLNLHVVGIILILAGTLRMLLPLLARSPQDTFRRWVVPLLARPGGGSPPGAVTASYDDGAALVRDSGANGDRPTLADDLLNFEHDPPL